VKNNETRAGDELIYGRHAVLEALTMEKVNRLYIQEDLKGQNLEQMKALASQKAVKVEWQSKANLARMTNNGVHQGFVALVAPFAYAELDQTLAQLISKEEVSLLILDELTDPHNLGSIARTADATGIDAIIIPKHRAVGITSVAMKASTGALEHVPVVRVTNLSQTLDKLKEAGFWTFGTDMTGTDYREWNCRGRIALIIGAEGDGISVGLKKKVDEMVSIPMVGHVQSLNASVAASLLMYEIFRRRQ
jgi:23S rRNA (guanosine2251-2'-O)-methyltransferase